MPSITMPLHLETRGKVQTGYFSILLILKILLIESLVLDVYIWVIQSGEKILKNVN